MAPPVLFTIFNHQYETEAHWVFVVGGALFALGVAVRTWAQVHLRYRLSASTGLTVTGPYASVRNPIYIANTLMLAAMCLMSELVWFVPLMVLWCMMIYGVAVRFEEYRLHGKYGQDYVRFRVNVPRWLPHWGDPVASGRRRWNSKHIWMSILAEVHCSLMVVPYVVKECVGS